MPENRFNDGKCDPAGRFWAGTLNYNLEKEAGSLYCLKTGLTVEKKLDGITISNGLSWNSRGDRFFFIDTPTGNISSFQYDIESGDITNRSLITRIDEKDGCPEGMIIDAEDRLWVALYGSGRVIRINSKTGVVEFEVGLPVAKPTSCTFGETSKQYDVVIVGSGAGGGMAANILSKAGLWDGSWRGL